MKPACGSWKFKQLIEQYLLDGFLTGSDHLLVSQPALLKGQGLTTMWHAPPGEALRAAPTTKCP